MYLNIYKDSTLELPFFLVNEEKRQELFSEIIISLIFRLIYCIK